MRSQIGNSFKTNKNIRYKQLAHQLKLIILSYQAFQHLKSTPYLNILFLSQITFIAR